MKINEKVVNVDVKSLMKKKSKVKNVDVFGEQVAVKTEISLSDRLSIADSVFTACFVDGTYYPALFDYMFRLFVIEYLTNIEIPNDKDEQEFMSLHSGIYERITEFVNPDELYELRVACSDQISIAIRNQQKSFDDLFEMIDRWLSNIGESLNAHDMDQMVQALTNTMNDPKKIATAASEYKKMNE